MVKKPIAPLQANGLLKGYSANPVPATGSPRTYCRNDVLVALVDYRTVIQHWDRHPGDTSSDQARARYGIGAGAPGGTEDTS